ncbi:MAG: hypothetical protein Q9227_009546 [Pyrenula ochraceoflavens]
MRFPNPHLSLLPLLLLPTTILSQTVYLAGDSTMAPGGDSAHPGSTQGWGSYLASLLTLPVVNNAIAGRSARSFTREGRFQSMANNVKSGDYVIIEFGHNDGGSLTPTDNGRTDCNPANNNNNYATTCQTTYNGVPETVLTFEAYLVNAARLFQAKGATVIISTATPNNPWETGTFTYGPSRFDTYDGDAAKAVGAVVVQHGSATASVYQGMGAAATDALFPNDHTHTSPAGAQIVAKAFVTALKSTSSGLKNYVR